MRKNLHKRKNRNARCVSWQKNINKENDLFGLEERKIIGMARTELKVLRVKYKLTQTKMAEKLGVGLTTYHFVESGKRNGSMTFWVNLQKVFALDDETIWKLQKNID